MRIETYGQKDLFLFQIADMERQIDAHVAMRDHVADSGKLSAEMDALFASILTPLCEGVAARKAALDALTTADHLRLAEEEQERMRFAETSTEEEEAIKAEVALFRCKLLREGGFRIPLASSPEAAGAMMERMGEAYDLRRLRN
jgi:hypothetical protein